MPLGELFVIESAQSGSYRDADLRQTEVCRTTVAYPLTNSFSCGNIAGIPLCCQQRRGACTRLEQGVPFLVRAPQR